MKNLHSKINLLDSERDTDIQTVERRERSVKRAERNLVQAEWPLYELYIQRDILVIKSWGDKPNWQAIYYISAPIPIKKNVRKGIYAERRKNPETYHGTEWKDRTHSAAFNGYAMNE